MRKLAMRACIKQVACKYQVAGEDGQIKDFPHTRFNLALSDFGDDAPYSLIRPILLRVENPEQLVWALVA